MDASTRVPTLAEFLACCQAEFDFLVQEYGFVLLASPREYNRYSACFRKGELGVDVYGESYGETASCDLVRGEDQLPLGLLVPVAQRGAYGRKGARSDQLAQVRENAARLKLHASDFLRGDSGRFNSAIAEWRRVTHPRPVSEAQRMERQRQQALTAAGHASKRADHA